MSVRRILTIFAAALVAAWAAYTAYWFHAQGQLRKGVERWAEQRRDGGWLVQWSDMTGGGYPAHLRLTLSEPAITLPSGLSWRAGRLTGEAAPFDWTRLHLDAGGEHRLDWPGGGMGVTATSARADINLDRRGALQDVTILLAGVSADSQAAEPVTLDGLAVTWDPLPVTDVMDHSQPSIRFSATGHGIRLPPLPALPLERDIALAEITGRIMGTIPPGPPAKALAAWSAEGGTLEIEHVSLDWAPMTLEGDGTLALDPQGQPLAAMATRIHGFGPLMDRLAEAGTIDPRSAQAAKFVLMMMSKPDSKGRPAVPVPIGLQDGLVSVGPTAVARLPPFQWE